LKRKGRKENTERTGDMRESRREKITVKGTCERTEKQYIGPLCSK
jgi:hypothetical protein